MTAARLRSQIPTATDVIAFENGMAARALHGGVHTARSTVQMPSGGISGSGSLQMPGGYRDPIISGAGVRPSHNVSAPPEASPEMHPFFLKQEGGDTSTHRFSKIKKERNHDAGITEAFLPVCVPFLAT